MTDYKIVPAKREGLKPLIGLYGKSGGGKTHSALLLARGIVGQKGQIVLIDTENRRGHIFSDLIPGGYNVLDMVPPFSPDRYIQALEACSKADIVVIDSMTHEWSGEGGVLDLQEKELDRMAGQDFAKRERCKMAAWIKPKMAHKKMVGQILRLPMPVICCLRGEEKTHSAKDSKGKNVVVTDDFCTPLFDHRFIFEMLINAEIYANDKGEGGYLRIGKVTHPDLRTCLPSKGEQIGIKHGEAMAKWCAAPGGSTNESTIAKPEEEVNFKKEIWGLLEPVWKDKAEGKPQLDASEKWLKEKAILPSDMSLADACADEEIAADIYAQIPIAMEGVEE